MTVRYLPILLLLGLFELGSGPTCGAAPLRTIREVMALTAGQAATRVPVDVEAVLLMNDPHRSTFFMHDGEMTCYTMISVPLRADLKLGHRYRVVGVTDPGGVQPIILVKTITHLGSAEEPEPIILNASNLFLTKNDAQWVQVEGLVESSSLREGGASLDVRVDGWLIDALLPRQMGAAVVLPWHLVGQRVRIRGVAAGNFNDQRQMLRRFISRRQ